MAENVQLLVDAIARTVEGYLQANQPLAAPDVQAAQVALVAAAVGLIRDTSEDPLERARMVHYLREVLDRSIKEMLPT